MPDRLGRLGGRRVGGGHGGTIAPAPASAEGSGRTRTSSPDASSIVIVGSPTALGVTSRAWSGRPATSAGMGWWNGSRPAPACAAGRSSTRVTPRVEPGSAPDADPRAKNRALPIENLRASPATSPPRSTPPLRCPPGPHRRRLHVPCGRPGRPAPPNARAAARPRLVRRSRRCQHAGHDRIGQRVGDAVRHGSRARGSGPRRRGRRAHGPRRGRRPARRPGPGRGRVADARVVPRGPLRGGAARRSGRPRGARCLGADRGDTGRRVLHRVRHGRPRRSGRLGAHDARTGRDPHLDGASRPSGSSRRPADRRDRVDGDDDPTRDARRRHRATIDAVAALTETALGTPTADGTTDDPTAAAAPIYESVR